MHEQLGVVTRKGQVTLPAAIRRALGIKEGDKVSFALKDDATGEITVKPVRSVANLTFGAVKPRKRPEDLKKLRKEFMEGVARQADKGV